MKSRRFLTLAAGAAASAALVSLRDKKRLRRVGMVIGIKPDKMSAYEALHAASNAGVRDLLVKYHMRNFSIFLQQLDDGRYYLFGYYEYTGRDYAADMAKLADEPRNQAWLQQTSAMQIPLAGSEDWSMMREVYYNH